MKKLSLFTATLLTVTALGGQGLTVHASANNWQPSTGTVNGNRIVVAFNGNLDSSSLMDKLLECIPGLRPNLPETETPDENTPETEAPDENKPEAETPDNPLPESKPETNNPENNLPDTNKPESNKPESDSGQNSENLSYAQQIVNLVNKERAKEGLSPLTVDKKLKAAAQVRAVEIEKSFSHTRPNGTKFSTALKEQGVSYRNAGENIAWGQRSPEEVVKAWMNSPGHRANIMNPGFKYIGVGYYQNASGVKHWSQLFTN